MGQHAGRTACQTARRKEERTSRDRPEDEVQLQLLHLLLLHGVLGLATLAGGDRLAGPARGEHAAGHCRYGMCVEEHAPENGLYGRGGGTVHCRSGIPRMVGDEQSRRLGRPAATVMVQPAGSPAEKHPEAYEAARHGARTARLQRNDATRRKAEDGTRCHGRRHMERICTSGKPHAHRQAVCRNCRLILC